jgi:amino acid adenylation domain-containing protein
MKKEIMSCICNSFREHAKRNAFVIDDTGYTYEQLARRVYGIAGLINSRKEKVIGIMAENKPETYASILAVLICGKTYVILHPSYPEERNNNISRQAGIGIILHSQEIHSLNVDTGNMDTVCSTDLDGDPPVSFSGNKEKRGDAYIIFTSGSTGEPKGVPISYDNLNAFYEAYGHLNWQLNETDRMLQMFELTFDLSIVSFLYPLTLGACVYTTPGKGIKYIDTIEILEKHELTFAAVAPSVIQLASPYFDEIYLPKLKYLILAAEASNVKLLAAFRKCVPNAAFINLYGPTEGTIYCTSYVIPPASPKHYNGMTAIGRPFDGIKVLLMDEDSNEILTSGDMGELCISGPQIMRGYWNSPEKSGASLVTAGNGQVYYKTGDLCKIDEDGDIIYCGRKDYQVKVNGFRIELSEIEYVAKNFFDGKRNVVVIPKYPEGKNCELHLIVEGAPVNSENLIDFLSKKLPYYMLPQFVHTLEHFPMNASSKTDRKKIQELI